MKVFIINLIIIVSINYTFKPSNYLKRNTNNNEIVDFISCLQESNLLDSIIKNESIFITYNDNIVYGISNRTFSKNDKSKTIYLVTKSHIFFHGIKEFAQITELRINNSVYYAKIKHYKYFNNKSKTIEVISITGRCDKLKIE